MAVTYESNHIINCCINVGISIWWILPGEPVHGEIKCSDLDSNGSPALVFGVGDGADTDYYCLSTAGQDGS